MITCRQFIEWMLDEPNDHLDDCPSCRAYLASYRRTIVLARALADDPLPDVPEELARAILTAAIKRERR